MYDPPTNPEKKTMTPPPPPSRSDKDSFYPQNPNPCTDSMAITAYSRHSLHVIPEIPSLAKSTELFQKLPIKGVGVFNMTQAQGHKPPHVFISRKWYEKPQILTWGSMGKCYKYVFDNFQIFTQISNIKLGELCKFIPIHLTSYKNNAQKTRTQVTTAIRPAGHLTPGNYFNLLPIISKNS